MITALPSPPAVECLNDRTPVLDGNRFVANLSTREGWNHATHLAVVDLSPGTGKFLGLLGVSDVLECRAGELSFGELATRKGTLHVPPDMPLEAVLAKLVENKQEAAAVVDETGTFLGAVTFEDIKRRLDSYRTATRAEYERGSPAMFERAAAGIGRVTPDGRWLDMNARMCEIVGCTPEDLLSGALSNITHPDYLKPLREKMRRTLAGEIGGFAMQGRFRCRGGAFVWVKLTVTLVRERGASAEPQYFILAVDDIDSRIREEDAMRDARDRLNVALRVSNTGLWDWNFATDIVRFSPATESHLGDEDEEIHEGFAEWTQRVHPDDLGRVMEQFEGSRSGANKQHVVEFRMRHRDGSWRWIRSRGQQLNGEDGRPVRMLGSHVDVTELKQLSDAAKASEVFLEGALDALSSSKAIVDETGTIRFVNSAWREFARCGGGERAAVSEGANYLDICDRSMHSINEAGVIARSLRSVLAGGSDPPPLEYACHSPTQQRWFQASVHGFTQGPNRFAVVTHQDVTLVHLAVERQALAAHREAMATLSAGMAHEFNSMLLAAATYLHGASAMNGHPHGLPPDPSIEKVAALIQQAQGLSASLLELFAAREQSTPPRLAIGAWLSECTRKLRDVLPQGTTIVTEPMSSTLEAHADPLALEQVLRILLTNAADALASAAPPGVGAGEVRVLAAQTFESNGATGGRGGVEIRVRDDGPGISEADRSRIFEPFFTTKGRSRRSGLGLAIASRLVEQQGGSLSYEPSTPRGSMFVIQLRGAEKPEESTKCAQP